MPTGRVRGTSILMLTQRPTPSYMVKVPPLAAPQLGSRARLVALCSSSLPGRLPAKASGGAASKVADFTRLI